MTDSEHVIRMQFHQIPLNVSYVSQLRRIKIQLRANVQWFLDYLEEIYRSEQLEELTIQGYIRLNEDAHLPRAEILRKWLTMSKSKRCNVRFHLSIISNTQNLNDLFADYTKIFGRNSYCRDSYLLIHYPKNIQTIAIDDDEDQLDAVDQVRKKIENKSKIFLSS
jgi:hypothetical protein